MSHKIIQEVKKMKAQIKRVEDEVSRTAFSVSTDTVDITIVGRGDLKTLAIKKELQSLSASALASAIQTAQQAAIAKRESMYKAKLGSYADGQLPPSLQISGIVQVQNTMNQVKAEVSAAQFSGGTLASGVELVINGKDEWLSLTINDALLQEDSNTLSAILTSALKEAASKKDKYTKDLFAAHAKSVIPGF